MVSPHYFGPNAFPIPEIVDSTSSRLRLDLEANYYHGHRKDHTTDITMRAVVPLWTPRANITVWLPVQEWYRHSEEFLKACNITPPYSDRMLGGHLTGDVYVSTDLRLLCEKRYVPDIVLRAGLKTASGGRSYEHRYYDSPGYFFDLTFGKTFMLCKHLGLSLRTALEGGFLCWQTGISKQNDAVMFGIRTQLSCRSFSLSETFSGYSGWEHLSSSKPELAHDTPMSLKTRLCYDINRWLSLYTVFEHGFSDFPYDRFSLGVNFFVNIKRDR